jgi:hypothetical protein
MDKTIPQKGQRWRYKAGVDMVLDLLDPTPGSGGGFSTRSLEWKILQSNSASYKAGQSNDFYIDYAFTYLKNQDKPNDLS